MSPDGNAMKEREREGGDRGRQADSKEKWHVTTDGEATPRFGGYSRVSSTDRQTVPEPRVHPTFAPFLCLCVQLERSSNRCVKAAKNDNVIQVGLLNLIGRGRRSHRRRGGGGTGGTGRAATERHWPKGRKDENNCKNKRRSSE